MRLIIGSMAMLSLYTERRWRPKRRVLTQGAKDKTPDSAKCRAAVLTIGVLGTKPPRTLGRKPRGGGEHHATSDGSDRRGK